MNFWFEQNFQKNFVVPFSKDKKEISKKEKEKGLKMPHSKAKLPNTYTSASGLLPLSLLHSYTQFLQGQGHKNSEFSIHIDTC